MNSNDVGFLLCNTSSVLIHFYDAMLQPKLGIGYAQFKVLDILKNTPKIKQKEIAKKLTQTEASISRQVKLMYNEGLLYLYVSPKNRRERIISLSPRGDRIYTQAISLIKQSNDQYFRCLSVTQKSMLIKALSDIQAHINE